MSSFPLGIRFCPTDEELITYYLKNVVMNQPLPSAWDRVMIVRDIYGESETATPWILFQDDDQWQQVVDPLGKIILDQKLIYVFTRLSKVGKVGDKNKNRRAGCGQWHGNTAKEPIRNKAGKGEIIGTKRSFTFKSQEETVGQWTMHEYELAGASLVGLNSYDSYVLCRIKRDDSKSSKGGRLVSRKNSKYDPAVQHNDHGVEATVQGLEIKRKSAPEEGNDQYGNNKKLRSDLIQEISDNNSCMFHAEQIEGFQSITSGVFNSSSSNDHRQSMHEDGTTSTGKQWSTICWFEDS